MDIFLAVFLPRCFLFYKLNHQIGLQHQLIRNAACSSNSDRSWYANQSATLAGTQPLYDTIPDSKNQDSQLDNALVVGG